MSDSTAPQPGDIPEHTASPAAGGDGTSAPDGVTAPHPASGLTPPPASGYPPPVPPAYGAGAPAQNSGYAAPGYPPSPYGAPQPGPAASGGYAPAPGSYPPPPAYPAGYGPPAAQYGYAAHPAATRTNPLAIASLVASLVGVVFSWTWVLGLGVIAGVILGHIALGQIARTGEKGRGLALAGVIVGWISLGFLLLLIVAFALFVTTGTLAAFAG